MGVMGQSRTVFGAVLFWGFLNPLVLVVGAQGSAFYDPALLACGQESLQLTLLPGWEGNSSFVLTTWGKMTLTVGSGYLGLQMAPEKYRSPILAVMSLNGMAITSCWLGLKDQMLLDKRFFMKRSCSGALWTFLITLTVHCTPDGQFSIAVSQDVTLPAVILDSVQLASGHSTDCVPVAKNNAFVVYWFPLSACGTTFQVTGDQAVYENELVASRDVKTGSLGSVTRDSTFRCPYAGDNYQTQLVPLRLASGLLFPSHYQCFTLYTFTFVDSTSQEMLSGLVYLHCSASVCHQSVQESCTTTCPVRARVKRSDEHPLQDSSSHVSSKGLVIFLQDELRWNMAKGGLGAAVHAEAPWALGFAAVATGAALCMVLVAAVLWRRKVPVTHEISVLQ
ncbi:unnamed protein product [Bubo scandiacus]